MTAEDAVLDALGPSQPRHEEALWLETELLRPDFDAAVAALISKNSVKRLEAGTLVRAYPEMSERARRVLAAVPSDGTQRSGQLIARSIGMQIGQYQQARKELKELNLVESTSGRGNGTLARSIKPRSKLKERLRHFREELLIDCEIDLPIGGAALRELHDAAFIEPHEGVTPTYGAMIVRDAEWEALPRLLMDRDFSALQVADSRTVAKFADGLTSFVASNESRTQGRLVITPAFHGLEGDAYELARELDVTVIQRTRAGVVRYVTPALMALRENGRWVRKSPAEDFVEESTPENADQKVARAIIQLCLHTLSANHVGATLIWFSDLDDIPKTGPRAPQHVDWKKAFAPPPMSITEQAHSTLWLHALAQLDRAGLIDSGGTLRWLGANLDAPTLDGHIEGGTRHNSAAAFSAQHANATVFVVSADGPVTIFRSGFVVRTTRV